MVRQAENKGVSSKKLLLVGPTPSGSYARTRFFVIALALLSLYAYGWRVTEIDVGELFRDFHLVTPLVRELAQPDLLTREKDTQIVEAEFFLSQKSKENIPQVHEATSPSLVLSRQSGEISDTLTVRGLNMKPGKSGIIYLSLIHI